MPKAKREVTRVVKAVYAKYEAEQARFDALEHQPGGTVDRLVASFVVSGQGGNPTKSTVGSDFSGAGLMEKVTSRGR